MPNKIIAAQRKIATGLFCLFKNNLTSKRTSHLLPNGLFTLLLLFGVYAIWHIKYAVSGSFYTI